MGDPCGRTGPRMLFDVIFVILALLWQRRKKLHKLEERKRKDAQVTISYVNHEIRNPLQTILGLADMELEEAQEDANHRLADNLGAIVGAAEFNEHIAADILDLRRVEEGKETSRCRMSTLKCW